jgi:hypothetical protein
MTGLTGLYFSVGLLVLVAIIGYFGGIIVDRDKKVEVA